MGYHTMGGADLMHTFVIDGKLESPTETDSSSGLSVRGGEGVEGKFASFVGGVIYATGGRVAHTQPRVVQLCRAAAPRPSSSSIPTPPARFAEENE